MAPPVVSDPIRSAVIIGRLPAGSESPQQPIHDQFTAGVYSVNMEPPTGPEAKAAIGGEQRSYQAYILRLWLEKRGGQPLWRASLEDPHNREPFGLPDLTQLFAF